MSDNNLSDRRFIEAGFPCHQVGAETQRERGASSALPPLYFLHVWWARRPLTPSRAAVLGSLLPEDTDPDWFLRELGIERVEALVDGVPWVITGKLVERIECDEDGLEWLPKDEVVIRALEKERVRRTKNREVIDQLCDADPSLLHHPVIVRWRADSCDIADSKVSHSSGFSVRRVAADPAHVNERIEFAKEPFVVSTLGQAIRWDSEDLYGYTRAYSHNPQPTTEPLTVLDPTAGGGSIPFEAMRLGHRVIANDLNPVAAVILKATLEYPAQFGESLVEDIQYWGTKLTKTVSQSMEPFTPFSPLPSEERKELEKHCRQCPEVVAEFDVPEVDQTGLLYVRQVTCPHCGGEAPLFNTTWLSKSGQKWGARIITDGAKRNGTVRFETYRVKGSKGPNGEDPELSTVTRGIGTCVHCQQAIDADEIKAQARGESPHGTWQDRLYCVVAVRYQPKLDKNGKPQRYKSGERKGEIKTEKIRFYRPPNAMDLQALEDAKTELDERWDEWDRQGLIPTERFPKGNDMRPPNFGMMRWCDMFTPRQLLGHVTAIETLNGLKHSIIQELGEERGRGVITYLQLALDKCLDYSSRQTMWHASRGVVAHTFTRHDFSVKWTFGELILTGAQSGLAWGLRQVVDAYQKISDLLPEQSIENPSCQILNSTAANLGLEDQSVDLVCFDPPYYNNVQYAELSDFFYVWQRRTLGDLYPLIFGRRITNKADEAVANPVRDGSVKKSKQVYTAMMGDIFVESGRVLKDDGVMTIMFTHKDSEAWEALTRSLIDGRWVITSSIPVESESTTDIHHKEMAAPVSSIFLTCRKRLTENEEASTWKGFGGTGIADKVREAVREGLDEFAVLRLNPVDEMVAGYGRALKVLSENWPVLDGDELVSPIRAMNEASAVVSQYQIEKLTDGRLSVGDLESEAAMSLTLFGIFGAAAFPFDEALNISRSLGIRLETKSGGYRSDGPFVGIVNEATGRRTAKSAAKEDGYHAPLLRKGSKLRLALPEERNEKRLEFPQTEWDILHGLIMAFRDGDVPVARNYLAKHGEGKKSLVLDLLSVWSAEIGDDASRKEADTILFGLK